MTKRRTTKRTEATTPAIIFVAAGLSFDSENKGKVINNTNRITKLNLHLAYPEMPTTLHDVQTSGSLVYLKVISPTNYR